MDLVAELNNEDTKRKKFQFFKNVFFYSRAITLFHLKNLSLTMNKIWKVFRIFSYWLEHWMVKLIFLSRKRFFIFSFQAKTIIPYGLGIGLMN